MATDAPPPSYEAATTSTNPPRTSTNFLDPHNGIPIEHRRSMEDEARPLPPGWVRQYDTREHHQYFVDTTKEPPRSIWSHPYDDETYLNSLSSEERTRITETHRVPSQPDIRGEATDDEEYPETSHSTTGHPQAQLPPRQQPVPTGIHKITRRMKDKLTSSTHEERVRERAQRAEEERRLYQRQQIIRAAMVKAMQTGQPQLLGKDKDGKDLYIEPPAQVGYPGRLGGGPAGGLAYGYNPYQAGVYSSPNARYIRPNGPYSRPYVSGINGGYGMPLAAGLGGGLLMGGLLGGAIF